MNKPKITNPFAGIDRTKTHPRTNIEGLSYRTPQPTLEEQIMKYCLTKDMTADQFLIWFNKEVKPQLDAEYDRREQQKYELRQAFEAKQKIKNMPENRIPTVFMGKGAYPKQAEEITKQYTLNDWFKVRRMAIEGKLDKILGASKIEFLTWISAIISQRCNEENPNTQETEGTLRSLIRLFRGNKPHK